MIYEQYICYRRPSTTSPFAELVSVADSDAGSGTGTGIFESGFEAEEGKDPPFFMMALASGPVEAAATAIACDGVEANIDNDPEGIGWPTNCFESEAAVAGTVEELGGGGERTLGLLFGGGGDRSRSEYRAGERTNIRALLGPVNEPADEPLLLETIAAAGLAGRGGRVRVRGGDIVADDDPGLVGGSAPDPIPRE